MNDRFKIISAVTYRTSCVLEAMFEFMLSHVAKTKPKQCNMFDFDRIIESKKPIRRGLYEFCQNIVAITSSQIGV